MNGEMRIIFQQPISGDGHGISFEIGEETATSRDELDRLLDRVTGAARRLACIEELPRARQLLVTKRKALDMQIKERERLFARMDAGVALRNASRRVQVPPPDGDTNALSQFDGRIADMRQGVMLLEQRIPWLEAIVRGEDIAEPAPPMLEAAE